MTKLFIKGMYTVSCKNAVRAVIEDLGLHYGVIEIGDIVIIENITNEQREQIRTGLLKHGLELMDDHHAIFIEKIKSVIIEMIYCNEEPIKQKYSDYIAEKLGKDYTYIATAFTHATGVNIEHYIIRHRIKRVKELISYNELSLKQIACQLGYSSVQYLCNQFKNETKITTSQYKKLKNKKRTPLENE